MSWQRLSTMEMRSGGRWGIGATKATINSSLSHDYRELEITRNAGKHGQSNNL